jgi:hypothetical protein
LGIIIISDHLQEIIKHSIQRRVTECLGYIS